MRWLTENSYVAILFLLLYMILVVHFRSSMISCQLSFITINLNSGKYIFLIS